MPGSGLILHRDYETRSTCDLRKCGVHVYAEDPTTEVIVAVFILEYPDGKLDKPVIWFPGEDVPDIVVTAARFPDEYVVAGHNAAFEQAIDRGVLGPRYGFPIFPDAQCDCTMARCAIQGLPQDLARACRAVGTKYQKDDAGHRLMMQMCKPRKPRKGEAPGLWWNETPDQIKRLTDYCVADVYAEIALGHTLAPISPSEKQVWLLDQRMNNKGVQVDLDFVETGLRVVDETTKRCDREIARLTQGHVTAASQLERVKEWCRYNGVDLKLETRTGRGGEEYEAEIADKEAILDLLDDPHLAPNIRGVLEVRLAAGKSSIKKLQKFKLQACKDGRARGTVQYHGAQPGRWAGRGIQLHNVRRDGISKDEGGWEKVAKALKELDSEQVELIFGSPLDLISRMLRGAVIAAPGHYLMFGDFSNVEARGCVWTAGQTDQVEMFASGGKIYEAMGAAIYNMPIEEVIEGHKTKANPMPRFLGKESVLGCGYGIGPAKFQKQVKKKARIALPDELAQKAIYGWRETNWRVVEYWGELERAAWNAIESDGIVFGAGPISYRRRGAWLQCRLPSGRILWYCRPSIGPKSEDDPRNCIHYWTLNGVTNQWEPTATWGGKLLQNSIEGLCRDFLVGAKFRLEGAGYPIILSVHDEVISEPADGFGCLEEFSRLMTVVPEWGRGFPLKCEVASGKRYAKA